MEGLADGPLSTTTVRLLTWNVQGSQGVDVDAVADVIRTCEPDVVALQEIQRRQAAALGRVLAMTGKRWVFKHWPIVSRAEGLAVLAAQRFVATSSFPVRRAPFWHWTRRVGLHVVVERDGDRFGVVDLHLSPHDEEDRRAREAAGVLARCAALEPGPIICGDFNDLPGRAGYSTFLAAGWIDAWTAVHDGAAAPGATNWTAGGRIGRPPTQRIDYVLAPPGSTVVASDVLAEASRWDDFAALSDHLPLVATMTIPVPASRRP